MWYWFFKFAVIGPLGILIFRPKWDGRDNLPRDGAFIVAANHMTMLDPPFISLGVPRKVIFVAKTKYYSRRGVRGRLLGWFLTAIGQTPIDPSSGTTAAPALVAAERLLAGGGVWAVFPEGTRSRDGRLHRGHTGVMRVALASGVPVIPTAVSGTRNPRTLWRMGRRRERITVTYGPAMDLRAWLGRAEDPAAWREATDALMSRIATLSGQTYVDEYAVSSSGP